MEEPVGCFVMPSSCAHYGPNLASGFLIVQAATSLLGPAIVVPDGVSVETPRALNGDPTGPDRLPLPISGFLRLKTTHFITYYIVYNSHILILGTVTL